MYYGAKWVEPAIFIDGDLIATGTMRGDRLIAGTEIKAPTIIGGNVIAGNVISTGTPPVFELLADGSFTARNANISGTIHAKSGQLDNVVINENCKIAGKLKVEKLEGDISKSYIVNRNEQIKITAVDYDRVLFIPSLTCICCSFTRSLPDGSTASGPHSSAYAVVKIDDKDVLNLSVSSKWSTRAVSKSLNYVIRKNVACTVSFYSGVDSRNLGSAPDSLFFILNRA